MLGGGYRTFNSGLCNNSRGLGSSTTTSNGMSNTHTFQFSFYLRNGFPVWLLCISKTKWILANGNEMRLLFLFCYCWNISECLLNWSQSSNNQNQTLITLSIIMKFLIHTLMDSFLSFGPLYIFFWQFTEGCWEFWIPIGLQRDRFMELVFVTSP